jgi:hypothetical protein
VRSSRVGAVGGMGGFEFRVEAVMPLVWPAGSFETTRGGRPPGARVRADE